MRRGKLLLIHSSGNRASLPGIAMKETEFPKRPEHERVALVLQGGGALGAYHVGVYQALDEHGFTPDWIAGTSIGAINASIIAGNKPGNRLARLEDSWRSVSRTDGGSTSWMPDELRQVYSLWSALGTNQWC
jgi:NTE family protein